MGARLGQHFLTDPGILGRIAEAAIAANSERVLEIGPGKGTLTGQLARRAAHVTSIEKDPRLWPALETAFAESNVTIVRGDALRVPWPPADVVCGNIPYQITSPLIERALEPPRPRRIVFLMQREVADRLAARAGEDDYGALSAGVQLVAEVERLFTVRAGAFRPPPKVESTVVRITPRSEPLAADAEEEARARRLIRALFQHRRQQIQRSLRALVDSQQPTVNSPAVDRRLSTVDAVLREAGFNPTARPEELSPAEFVTLARLFPTA